jgi:benzoyl-CoA-dihydrodiol lyase
VNFCKFTNETRNEIEDAAANSGQVYLAAVNAACAGGGYELALACDRIILVDDNSSTVSLPEVSLLGVLPGTGGLTRLTDKRGVRKDLADLFATRSDGVKGQTAIRWKLVDELAPRREFRDAVRRRALEIAEGTRAEGTATSAERAGIKLEPLRCEATEDGMRYSHVEASYERDAVAITIRADEAADWLLTMTRELDDLILRLRFNKPELGTWLIRTSGDVDQVMAHERAVLGGGDRLGNETLHYYKRTLKRLDVTSRSLIALIEPGSCFAGVLLELALACDRQYMLDDVEGDEQASIRLTEANFGPFPMASGLTRLQSRFYLDEPGYERVAGLAGRDIGPAEAAELGLITAAPDDIDWEDEIRIAVEGRAALSPDALTGMEASLRFAGPETMETKIFGRLTAWQNWVFSRPNAAGPDGALRRYGTGRRPAYDRRRT